MLGVRCLNCSTSFSFPVSKKERSLKHAAGFECLLRAVHSGLWNAEPCILIQVM